MDLQKVGCGGMNWFELAHNTDRWQALINVVMNLRRTLLHGVSSNYTAK